MSNVSLQPDHLQGNPDYYKILIKGHLALSWSDVFEGMELTWTRCDDTLITGPILDQAALHGLLARVRDLNLILISVVRVEPEHPSQVGKRRSR
jgi:hypothetical protein